MRYGHSVLAVGAAFLLHLIFFTASEASATPPSSNGFAGGNQIEVGVSRTSRDAWTPNPGSGSGNQNPPVEVVQTPACGRNGPEGSFGTDTCRASTEVCPPGQIFITTWTRTGNAAWVNQGSTCTAEATAGEPVALPAVTEADLRRIPLPAGAVNLQPSGGEALLNVPLILTTTDDVVTRDTTVLGFPVTIRATPSTWTWTLGDGSTLGPTSDPGNSYPHETLTHTYTDPGDHEITLTTTYTGEYTIAGLPYRPIVGTATVTSPVTTVHVLAGQNVLTR